MTRETHRVTSRDPNLTSLPIPLFFLFFSLFFLLFSLSLLIGVRSGVSKGVEDGRRLLAWSAGHPWNGSNAISGVACPQGIDGLGMANPGETLGSPWPPLAIRPSLSLVCLSSIPLAPSISNSHIIFLSRFVAFRFQVPIFDNFVTRFLKRLSYKDLVWHSNSLIEFRTELCKPDCPESVASQRLKIPSNIDDHGSKSKVHLD
jgi:hypothetical protein